jgi:hypothetical protein
MLIFLRTDVGTPERKKAPSAAITAPRGLCLFGCLMVSVDFLDSHGNRTDQSGTSMDKGSDGGSIPASSTTI